VRPDARPTPPGQRPKTGWGAALLRGFLVFALLLAIGLATAFVGVAATDAGLAFGAALRIGALYLGPFNHVALVFEGVLHVDLSRLPGSGVLAGASATVELGVALLVVTGLAVWLLFRAGRASAYGDHACVRALTGARVGLGYGPPILLIALLVRFEQPNEIGSFVSAGVRVSLSVWQALVLPLAIAAAAGAAGGVWSWAGASERGPKLRVRAVLGSGWMMFLLALGLSFGGLLVAGVVQPDEPVALATPSTARYFARVFERPRLGAMVLAHHLALAPNEALWTLVPASGACDVVRGSEGADILCLGSFPLTKAGEAISFGSAPGGYLAFLLVPAVATLFGGRRASLRAGRDGWSAVADGATAGVAYGVLVGVGCLLASVTLSYAASTGTDVGGRLWIGPDPVWGTITAIAWGLAGGAIGAASRRLTWSGAAPRGPGTATAR
jgi:hypothetical protein